MGQVISNLVQNAVVHPFAADQNGLIKISATADVKRVKIMVSDNGKGISDADSSCIFDPFFTTKLGQGGSGLELHIVHNIVFGMLCGEIKLLHLALSGACFVISIPKRAPNRSDSGVSAYTI